VADTYDVVIIGAGPGGYVAAIRAGQLGLRVALVEKEHLGGTCLNIGCIPTKALLRTAEVLTLAREGEAFVVHASDVRLDLAKAMERKDAVVLGLRRGVESLMAKNKVTVVRGTGLLLSPTRVRVTAEQGIQELDGRAIIIATGAAPKSLPGVTIDEDRIISSTGALLLSNVPTTLGIIGAGAVGVEFASLYADFGSKVTIMEMLPQILPLEDKDSAAEVARSFRARGIRMLVGARVEEVTPIEAGVRVQVTASDGTRETLEFERLLMAVGRRPLSEGLGLEALGVQMERGFILVDGRMRTNIPSVYAIGDVVALKGMGTHLQLAHVASAEGILAVETIAGRDTRPLDYDAIPRATYARPEVASIGLSEDEAAARGYQIKVGKFPLRANSKAPILGERGGMVKIVAEARYGELLGVHIAGPSATELIAEVAVAKRLESTAEELARTVHAHPTLSEAVKEAAHAVLGEAIHI